MLQIHKYSLSNDLKHQKKKYCLLYTSFRIFDLNISNLGTGYKFYGKEGGKAATSK
jgi:hypothetical protein